jgi:TolA-binding protein
MGSVAAGAILLLALGGLGLGFGRLFWESRLEGKSLAAAEEFYRAPEGKPKLAVAERYSELPESAIWFLEVASAQWQRGKTREAEEIFARFTVLYPKHELFWAAKLGRAECLYEEGRGQEAAGLYQELLAQEEKSPWQELAYVGLARVEEDSGKPAEAKKILQQFLSRYPSSRLEELARRILDRLPASTGVQQEHGRG